MCAIEFQRSTKRHVDNRLEVRVEYAGVDVEGPFPIVTDTQGRTFGIEPRIFSYELFNQRYRSLAYVAYWVQL